MMLTKIRRSVNHPIRQLEQIGDLGYFDFLNRLAPPPGRAHQAETKEGYGPHQSLSIATCRGRHEQRRPRWGDGIAAPDSLRAAVKPKIFSERLPQAVTRPLGAARPRRRRRHGTHRRAACEKPGERGGHWNPVNQWEIFELERGEVVPSAT